MKNIKPKVSIICTTYNHKNFIRQALDGFIMQQTNFPFEVLLYDDASTDGTTDIVREYAEKYPDIIKPIIQTENQFSKGIDVARTFIWPKIRGEYVAVCDGDDYWTDPQKLQKQADFLDNNPDYSICHAAITQFWEDKSQPESVWPRHKKELTRIKHMYENGIANCTVMYRWVDPTESWPTACIYPPDWFLHMLHACHGKIKFFPDIVARYRRHGGGISFAGTSGNDTLHLQWGVQEMQFFTEVESRIAPDRTEYHKHVCERAREIINAYAMNNDFDKAITVLRMCPDALNVPESDRTMQYRKTWQKRFNRLLAFSIVLVIIIIIGGIWL